MSNEFLWWNITSWIHGANVKCFRLLSFFQSLYNHMICFGQLGAPAVREWFPWWCERNQLPSTPGRNSSLLPCFFKPRGQHAQIEPAREVVHELPAKAGFNSGLQVHVKFCPVLNCFGLRHSICSYIITWRYVWMFKGCQPFNLCLGVWPQYGWRHLQIAAVLSPVSCNAINGVRDTHSKGSCCPHNPAAGCSGSHHHRTACRRSGIGSAPSSLCWHPVWIWQGSQYQPMWEPYYITYIANTVPGYVLNLWDLIPE